MTGRQTALPVPEAGDKFPPALVRPRAGPKSVIQPQGGNYEELSLALADTNTDIER